MNTVSGFQHAEEIPIAHSHSPIPPIPSHLQKNILCCLNSLSIVLNISLVVWQHSYSFIQASFLLNHVLADRRQLCRSHNRGF